MNQGMKKLVCGVETGILLEAGTNELEALIIRLGDNLYGVNVAKVREVIPCPIATKIPLAHPAVEGSVNIRSQVVELVNLATLLELSAEERSPRSTDRMLIMEFNQEQVGFRLHDVLRIVRCSWSNVMPVPKAAGMRSPVTAIIDFQGQLVQLLDFEALGALVGMSQHVIQQQDRQKISVAPAVSSQAIVYADDSLMIREMIKDHLEAAGFKDIIGFPDGAEAWQYLEGLAKRHTEETIRNELALIITDIEMPRMDGFHLTKRIRENPVLRSLPIIVFSSIVSGDNLKKGQQVGASKQVAKPRYAELAKAVEGLLMEAGAPLVTA